MKRTKKAEMILITVAAICALTACGGKDTERETEQSVETESSRMPEDEVTQRTESENAESETTESGNEETDIPDQESIQATDATVEPEPFTPVAGLSDNYADLEKRCFAYDGQIYTLGECTLQDLIDGGIPFDENDLNNIGNNVNRNYETRRYSVRINDYVNMQFSFVNTTDSNISEAECLLRLVRWYSIYVPQPDYEDSMNEKITDSIRDAQNHVCFSFPLTLTLEQLLENNGNPTDIVNNNSVQYYVDSEVYMGKSGYTFEFNKKTNQLEDLSISWLP